MPPQAKSVYRLLLKEGEMTAVSIGRKLNVYPNTVYRAIKPLIDYSLIERVGHYPTYFKARPVSEAIGMYLSCQRKWFINSFSLPESKPQQEPEITFVQNRQSMLESFTKDINSALAEVDLLVSGFELPAETVLAVKRAIDRGVKVKVLVQESKNLDKEMIGRWERMGMSIRFCPSIDVRLITIDQKIAYVVSYQPEQDGKATGVRFFYPAITELVQEMFDSKWSKLSNFDFENSCGNIRPC